MLFFQKKNVIPERFLILLKIVLLDLFDYADSKNKFSLALGHRMLGLRISAHAFTVILSRKRRFFDKNFGKKPSIESLSYLKFQSSSALYCHK